MDDDTLVGDDDKAKNEPPFGLDDEEDEEGDDKNPESWELEADLEE